MLKITFDFVVSFFLLISFSPFLIMISIFSLLIQGLPILFFHQRLGKNGIPFTMVKFRTMKNGPSISAEHDITRLTYWGRILRKTSIDELPVLFNVLKGNMSLVGPRPLPVKYFSRFNSFQKQRMNVKPGVTGLAQIYGRNNLSWEERFDYDIEYIQKKSFIFDLYIIFLTIFLVIFIKNVDGKNQKIMSEFMGSSISKKKNENQS